MSKQVRWHAVDNTSDNGLSWEWLGLCNCEDGSCSDATRISFDEAAERLNHAEQELASLMRELEDAKRQLEATDEAGMVTVIAKNACIADLQAENEKLRAALSWALDIQGIDEALIKEQLPDAWASLDHDALARGKAKAAETLASLVESHPTGRVTEAPAPGVPDR